MTSKHRRRGLNITVPQILCVMALVAGASVISRFTQKMDQTQRIQALGNRLSVTATAEKAENAALTATLAYVESDSYPKREAPSVLKMIPADGVFVNIVPNGQAAEAPTPASGPPIDNQVSENFQVWSELFFGSAY